MDASTRIVSTTSGVARIKVGLIPFVLDESIRPPRIKAKEEYILLLRMLRLQHCALFPITSVASLLQPKSPRRRSRRRRPRCRRLLSARPAQAFRRSSTTAAPAAPQAGSSTARHAYRRPFARATRMATGKWMLQSGIAVLCSFLFIPFANLSLCSPTNKTRLYDHRYDIGMVFQTADCMECECLVGGQSECKEKTCSPCSDVRITFLAFIPGTRNMQSFLLHFRVHIPPS